MKHKHTTNTVGYTTPWARVGVPLMLLAAFVLGATPERALADKIVIIKEPEPSWVVVGTAPPSLRVEVRPPRPFPGAVWVSGYWWWSGVRYVWIGGHYGHRHLQGYRYTTRRSYPQAHGPRYRDYDDKPRGHGKGHHRAHDDKSRGHGKGHYRDYDAHDGRGGHHAASPPARRTAPVPPRANPSRSARATPQRTAPTPRASSRPRPARPSRVAPVARAQSSRSARLNN